MTSPSKESSQSAVRGRTVKSSRASTSTRKGVWWGIPDYGQSVWRRRLNASFEASRPHLVVLVGPGGYGKSVLTSQFISNARPAVCVWHDAGRRPFRLDELLYTITAASGQEHSISEHLAHMNERDIRAEIEEVLGRWKGREIIIVADGISEVVDTEPLEWLAGQTRRLGGGSSGVLATTRILNAEGLGASHDSWIIEPEDLRLDRSEAGALAELLAGSPQSDRAVEKALGASGGHVALFCLVARHVESGPVSEQNRHAILPRDVKGYLQRSAAALDFEEMQTLLVAAVLGADTLAALNSILGRGAQSSLRAVSHAVPLVSYGGGKHDLRFRSHDLASDVFSTPDFAHQVPDGARLVKSALARLRLREDYARLIEQVRRHGDDHDLAQTLGELGDVLLCRAQGEVLRAALEEVPPALLMENPHLLLLRATVLRTGGEHEVAIDSARTALRLAEHEEDRPLMLECRLLLAETYVDTWEPAKALDALHRMQVELASTPNEGAECLLGTYLAMCNLYTGDVVAAIDYARTAVERARSASVPRATQLRVNYGCGFVLANTCGDMALAADLLSAVVSHPTSSASLRVRAQANLGYARAMMGRLDEAHEMLEEVVERIGGSCMAMYLSAATASLAAVVAVEDPNEGLGLLQESNTVAAEIGDEVSYSLGLIEISTVLRFLGRGYEALAAAERAYRHFMMEGVTAPAWRLQAGAERAAARLSLGETLAATDDALAVRQEASSCGLKMVASLADMVLAEVERRGGHIADAVVRLSAHEDFIRSESANWRWAMYIRAFPGLLGVLAAAIGADRLPSHLLRMVTRPYADEALLMAREVLDPAAWDVLAERTVGTQAAAAIVAETAARPGVRVGLFGGLTVETPDGPVSDRAWKKRKARLLFAMLVSRQGHDIPREQLMEHLWPDMDEQRAKSNFYVIWSAMRRALGAGTPAADCVEHVAGVCRVVPGLVRSDLDDFDEVNLQLQRAEKNDDHAEAVQAAHALCMSYRAEVLPSELYDDWFRPVRERYRAEFGDAMLRAARVCRAHGDYEQALKLIREGLDRDPWREDLYQAALRAQIDAGQRSGAVETFMTCRAKLSEDLGLDPSAETRRLYDEVLAMEERS